MLGVPIIRGLVEKLRGITRDDKSMGKAGWNPELPLVFSRKHDTNPFAEIRRTPPQIDGDIEDFTLRRTHQFSLGMLDLIMEAPEDSPDRTAVIVLHEVHVQAGCLFEVALIEALEERRNHVHLRRPSALKSTLQATQ